jgi:hypothetical protein
LIRPKVLSSRHLGGKRLATSRRQVNPLGGFDCFLSSAAEALAADGVKRQTIMNLFITHALEVLQKTPGIPRIPPNTKKNADTVLQAALHLHSLYDDPERRQTDERGE